MSDQPDPNTWPLTVDAAVDHLLSRMKDADKETVRGTPEADLIRFHFGWGMGIRNAFGLWQGNTQLLESCGGGHPDDASSVIIRAVWKRLQEAKR
jgi:hypothetical protein